MLVGNVLRLYCVRLHSRAAQECLAVAGIAAGVALLFASQVASSSLQDSVSQLSRGILGRATLQLLARGPGGLPGGTLTQARSLPGVRIAAPILETDANAIGPHGQQPVELIGADESLRTLGGKLTASKQLSPFGGIGAVAIAAPLARSLGVVGFGQEVTLQVNGRETKAPLYAQLHEAQIGSLTSSPVILAPLGFSQRLAGLPKHVSGILIEPAHGRESEVRRELRKLGAGRANVEPASYVEAQFEQAAASSSEATSLFAAISALVGFLFAFNAVLLTAPQRRRLVADLQREGYAPKTALAIVLVDAAMLGVVGSALGLLLGYELSIDLLRAQPAFLSLAFPVGTQQTIEWQSVPLAVAGGMLAAAIAVVLPILGDLLSVRFAWTSSAIERRMAQPRRLALSSLACAGATAFVPMSSPQTATIAMVLLVAALLLMLPLTLSCVLGISRLLSSLTVGAASHIATMEVGSARARAVAVSATCAVAVFGATAIQGAHDDLLHGLSRAARQTSAFARMIVAPAGAQNLLDTAPFAPIDLRRLAHVRGVSRVSSYRGSLLDYGTRRVLVIAPPVGARSPIAGQIVSGDAQVAARRVARGGWVVLSSALAREHDLTVGERLVLPSPVPRRLKVAAFSTNLGWAPGAIVMNAADYARAWGSNDPSAYAIALTPGSSPTKVADAVRRVLGPHSGLSVQTATSRTRRQQALSRSALARLTQIATVVPIAAVLAMAAAIGGILWQRRPSLARLRLEGLRRAQLWRSVLLESLLLTAVGCLAGATFGLYGERLADRALVNAVNFPVVYSVTIPVALRFIALVTLTAIAILSIPGYAAASVAPELALQD